MSITDIKSSKIFFAKIIKYIYFITLSYFFDTTPHVIQIFYYFCIAYL